MDFTERQNLFNVRKTVLEMLEDRNYMIPDSEKINFDDFTIKFNNKNLDIFIDDLSESKEMGKVYIYFHNENKTLPKAELKNLLNKRIQLLTF